MREWFYLTSAAKNEPWYLYVVECSDGSLYTGVTTNVSRRIYEHNTTSRGAKYTRSRRPVKLVYQAGYPNRSAACRAETLVKKLSRKEKLELIKSPAKEICIAGPKRP